jgi:signal transduction protein with GAF and PtsI domain
MKCSECLSTLSAIAEAFNSPLGTKELLAHTAKSIVEELHLKACQFRLLSRDQKLLEHVTSYGLSEKFLAKGPVEAEKSVTEALEGKTIVVADCATDPRIQYPDEHVEEGLVSVLTVPLKTRGQVIGVMRLYAGEKRPFSDLEVSITEVMASFCTRAVTHSMFHQIQDRVSSAIRSSLNLEEVLDSVARVISEELRAKGCTIQLLGADEKLEIKASFGLSNHFLEVRKAHRGGRTKAALQGECVQVVDAKAEPRSPFFDEVIQEGISSILFVPLMMRDKAIGVLNLCTHHPYRFSEDEIFFMKSIGDQCALAVQHSRIHAKIHQDYQALANDFQLWFESGRQ